MIDNSGDNWRWYIIFADDIEFTAHGMLGPGHHSPRDPCRGGAHRGRYQGTRATDWRLQ